MGETGSKKNKEKAKKQKQAQIDKKKEQQKAKMPVKNPVQIQGTFVICWQVALNETYYIPHDLNLDRCTF